MFSLDKQESTLTSVNPRAELHGEDKHLAVDLGFAITVSNDVLSEFDPALKNALYRVADASDSDMFKDEPGYLPKLRFPLLGSLKWGKEYAGYSITVHYGVSGNDIHMGDCDVDKFRFDCKDGGSVGVSFRVIAHPKSEDLGRLCEMIQQGVTLSLVAPADDMAGGDE
ncbi:hypothetical protein [Methyloversatilis sp. XJ19-49]|uniref:hypothetical protein n=1 Tax=Methyloversatilis sp. XJ19-49 TaxID=2963429 RepID=UPI00211BA294|nr:hypothetical protein [Methyloversatilis sp. XJ19-49]MCQ9378839.1 hypothetical protein [Methyloversatilis sp. XJ19-49]